MKMQFARRYPGLTVLGVTAVAGFIGFVGGIVWCLLVYPGSPQAPIFGMFFTGPAGAVVGLILGFVLVSRASRDSNGKNGTA
jgi:zinc transporter ZupT